MRVLVLSSYITLLGDPAFEKNITGFGHMVRDIADYVSRFGVGVDVLTTSAITTGRSYRAVTILKRTWTDLLRSFKPYYIGKALQFIFTARPNRGNAIRILYYNFSAGYVEAVVRKGRYDVVHLHGLGFHTQAYIECCERVGVKYLITLHGLNTYNESNDMDPSERRYEAHFLRWALARGIPMTVVSTGLLAKIRQIAGAEELPHLDVVNNGTVTSAVVKVSVPDIRVKYGVAPDRKILLCVGNVSPRKNQAQIVRAYALLPEAIRDRIYILFLGKECTAGEVPRQIAELGLQDHLLLCGNIRREEILAYYSQADFTILASISEGYGLSIIEGFVHGLPSLTFADLDAIGDLYDGRAMIALPVRGDADLAKGIVQLVSTEWDRGFISGYAARFSLERMAEEYGRVYAKICSS